MNEKDIRNTDLLLPLLAGVRVQENLNTAQKTEYKPY
jgi:hypothetical protein